MSKTKKKSASKKAPKIAGPRDSLVVRSKVREYIAESQMRMSADVIDAVSEVVVHHLDRAIFRARQAGRSTVKPSDL